MVEMVSRIENAGMGRSIKVCQSLALATAVEALWIAKGAYFLGGVSWDFNQVPDKFSLMAKVRWTWKCRRVELWDGGRGTEYG
jgi:hypothetical protein